MANEYREFFKQALLSRRRNMKPKVRERTRNSPKKVNWLYPVSSEVKYIRMIREQVGRELRNVVNEEVGFNLQSWIDEKKRTDEVEQTIKKDLYNFIVKKGPLKNEEKSINLIEQEIKKSLDKVNVQIDTFSGTETHGDTWIDDINQLIIKLNAKIIDIFGGPEDPPEDSEMWGFLLLIAAGVFIFNEKQWNKISHEFLGFEFTTDTAWWGDVQAAWASENYTLIKSLSEEYIGKLNEVVFRGVRDGLSYREIIKELNNTYGKVFGPRKDGKMSRTELLVRDQIGKLNGLITKNRMQEAGAEYYIWQTAFDERVRGRPGGRYPRAIPSHWEMQGKICRWDNNSLYSDGQRDGKGRLVWLARTGKMPIAIPGQEILCRCTALIYWEEILKEVDGQIEREAV